MKPNAPSQQINKDSSDLIIPLHDTQEDNNGEMESEILSDQEILERELKNLPFAAEDNKDTNTPLCDPLPKGRTLRDRAKINKPVRYVFYHHYEPKRYEEAMRCSDSKFWGQAVNDELNNIQALIIWEDFEDESNVKNPLNTTWVFKIKDNSNQIPTQFKARLCVQGFQQIQGIDFEETWAPTGKNASLKILLIHSLNSNLKITQFDVKGAFSHAPIEEEVFIKTPM